MLPIECVVRGYLAGSGWKDYQATGAVCGHRLPPGPARVRPAAAADLHAGHQGRRAATTSTSIADAAALPGGRRRAVRPGRAAVARRSTSTPPPTRSSAASSSPTPSSSSGSTPAGELVLVDEVLTPDSSRFWPADDYAARPLAGLVRQAVRARLAGDAGLGQAADPARSCRGDVVAGTRARYVEAYERLTGEPFERLPATKRSADAMKVTVLVRPRDGILDPQGEAVRRSLAGLGYPAAGRARGQGVRPRGGGRRRRGRAADRRRDRRKVLSNPLIEQYEVEVAWHEGRRRQLPRAPATTATRCTRSSWSARSRCALWHADPDLGGVDAVIMPGRLQLRRLPAAGRAGGAVAGDGGRARARRRRPAGAGHLQRLPGADRDAAGAGRAAAERQPQVPLPRRGAGGRARVALAAGLLRRRRS